MNEYATRIFLIFLFLPLNQISFSQNTAPNKFIEWTSWTLIQTIPSPTFFQDRDENNSRFQFGFRWNITPLNYSFNANKLISPLQFFIVNPVRRNGGSVELFVQPEWATSSFQYSGLKRFNLAVGTRFFIPAEEVGEYLSFSLGGKYNIRKNNADNNINFYSIEGGLYTLFGILGLQFNYNFNSGSKYDIGINLRYY